MPESFNNFYALINHPNLLENCAFVGEINMLTSIAERKYSIIKNKKSSRIPLEDQGSSFSEIHGCSSTQRLR